MGDNDVMPNFLVIVRYAKYGNWQYMPFEFKEPCYRYCNAMANAAEISRFVDAINVYEHDADTGSYILLRRYI